MLFWNGFCNLVALVFLPLSVCRFAEFLFFLLCCIETWWKSWGLKWSRKYFSSWWINRIPSCTMPQKCYFFKWNQLQHPIVHKFRFISKLKGSVTSGPPCTMDIFKWSKVTKGTYRIDIVKYICMLISTSSGFLRDVDNVRWINN